MAVSRSPGMTPQVVAFGRGRRSNGLRIVVALFVVVCLVHLVAQLARVETLAAVTQWFVMPLLGVAAAILARRPWSHLVRWVVVALAFSWLGDSVPGFLQGNAPFLAMVGFFLLAQASYVVAFWPRRRRSLARHPLALVPYLAAFVALVVACAPGAGVLLAAVVVYGVFLATMAVLATGVNRLAGIGGAVFLVSDALIALATFAPGFVVPGPAPTAFWIMATYLVGQTLLVGGVLQADSSSDRELDRSADGDHGRSERRPGAVAPLVDGR